MTPSATVAITRARLATMWISQMLSHYPDGFHFRAATRADLLLKQAADA